MSRCGLSAGEECRLESSLRQQHADRWYCCCFIPEDQRLPNLSTPTATHQPQRGEPLDLGARKAKARLGGPGYSTGDVSGTWRGLQRAIGTCHRDVSVVPLEVTGALGQWSSLHRSGSWPLSKHRFPHWKAVSIVAHDGENHIIFWHPWVLANTYLAWSQSHCPCSFLIWHCCTQWAALLQNKRH